MLNYYATRFGQPIRGVGRSVPTADLRGAVPVRSTEMLYLTREFPHGIIDGVLRTSNSAIQRDTALFWFASNLKPYSGPWFSFDGAAGTGFDQAKFAPAPLDAHDVLHSEFDGVLREELVGALGAFLGADWMWKEPFAFTGDHVASGTANAAILLMQLDEVTDHLRHLGPRRGGIGDNHPDGPLTEEEQTDALNAVETIRAAVTKGAEVTAEWLKATWIPVARAAEKTGAWAGQLLATFVSDILREGGPAIGKKLPQLIIFGVAITACTPLVFRLAEAFLKH